jgi:hypothetical protein
METVLFQNEILFENKKKIEHKINDPSKEFIVQRMIHQKELTLS